MANDKKVVDNRSFSERNPILSTALQFGGIGAGTAAAAALVRELMKSIEDKKKAERRQKASIDPGTIVLRIPSSKAERFTNKYAEGCADPEVCKALEGSHDKVTKTESLHTRTMPVGTHATEGLQRDIHGRFTDAGTSKIASNTSVMNRTGQILAAVGATAGGYYLVDKIRQKLEQHRLKKQIEAAQQAYIGLIDGTGVKNAEAVNKLFMVGDFAQEKKAGVFHDLFNAGDSVKNIGAAGLAAYIAAALGTGYVTKRVLESRFDPEEGPEEEPQKVNRIMFKTYDPEPVANSLKNKKDDEKAAEASDSFEVDPEAALATLGMYIECMSAPEVKEAADYSFLDKVVATDDGKQWLI